MPARRFELLGLADLHTADRFRPPSTFVSAANLHLSLPCRLLVCEAMKHLRALLAVPIVSSQIAEFAFSSTARPRSQDISNSRPRSAGFGPATHIGSQSGGAIKINVLPPLSSFTRRFRYTSRSQRVGPAGAQRFAIDSGVNMRPSQLTTFVVAMVLLGSMTEAANGQSLPNLFPLPNRSGLLETYNVNHAPISLTGAFFQSLGTNGRSCGSCHRPAEGWSVSAADVQLRFLLTQGLDPIFRTNDGSNCDQDIDTSTVQARRQAYSLLLSRGLIRIALHVPSNAEFTVESVNNPYGCSDTSTLSMYRRPLPATNLEFLSTLMWDGRESTPPSTVKITYPDTGQLLTDLSSSSDSCHHRPCAGCGSDSGTNTRHRELRDGPADRPGIRLSGRPSERWSGNRRPGRSGLAKVLYRH